MDTAYNVGALGRDTVKLLGHEVFWRKCVRKEPDGIVLAEKTRDYCNVAEVLAVGPKCGTVEKNKVKRKISGWPYGQVFDLKPGDFILLPDVAGTITHPHVHYEGMIHELDIIAKIE